MPYNFDRNQNHYYFNNKNSVPIIFIHGLGLNQSMWKPQIDFFKNNSFVTYDLLGHGKTPFSENILTMKKLAGQLLVLIENLKIYASTMKAVLRLAHTRARERVCLAVAQWSICLTERSMYVFLNRDRPPDYEGSIPVPKKFGTCTTTELSKRLHKLPAKRTSPSACRIWGPPPPRSTETCACRAKHDTCAKPAAPRHAHMRTRPSSEPPSKQM